MLQCWPLVTSIPEQSWRTKYNCSLSLRRLLFHTLGGWANPICTPHQHWLPVNTVNVVSSANKTLVKNNKRELSENHSLKWCKAQHGEIGAVIQNSSSISLISNAFPTGCQVLSTSLGQRTRSIPLKQGNTAARLGSRWPARTQNKLDMVGMQWLTINNLAGTLAHLHKH